MRPSHSDQPGGSNRDRGLRILDALPRRKCRPHLNVRWAPAAGKAPSFQLDPMYLTSLGPLVLHAQAPTCAERYRPSLWPGERIRCSPPTEIGPQKSIFELDLL